MNQPDRHAMTRHGGEKMPRIVVSMPAEIVRRLDAYAARYRRSRSGAAAFLIEEGLARDESGEHWLTERLDDPDDDEDAA